MNPTATAPLSAGHLVDVTGATYRQVDHWTRTGWLADGATPGSGSRRGYDDDDVRVCRALVEAHRLGVHGSVRADLAQAVGATPGRWVVVTPQGATVVDSVVTLAAILATGSAVVVTLGKETDNGNDEGNTVGEAGEGIRDGGAPQVLGDAHG